MGCRLAIHSVVCQASLTGISYYTILYYLATPMIEIYKIRIHTNSIPDQIKAGVMRIRIRIALLFTRPIVLRCSGVYWEQTEFLVFLESGQYGAETYLPLRASVSSSKARRASESVQLLYRKPHDEDSPHAGDCEAESAPSVFPDDSDANEGANEGN